MVSYVLASMVVDGRQTKKGAKSPACEVAVAVADANAVEVELWMMQQTLIPVRMTGLDTAPLKFCGRTFLRNQHQQAPRLQIAIIRHRHTSTTWDQLSLSQLRQFQKAKQAINRDHQYSQHLLRDYQSPRKPDRGSGYILLRRVQERERIVGILVEKLGL